ncbi:dienelactone hydrolase family protein [Jatrophihabitans sp. GAS493]|uniref:dienelactone hydrolase family protein n=1 Tax=Jatrophihabitans sp. GAS493 TaxID=1907575 RepID=UPI000BB8593E|nr:dienelactone hydrolase family protein [Jatrophihabitans sp. GAS493]
MTDVVLYHHIQGLTDGVLDFADQLRDAGHTVVTPDLYDGATFDVFDDGVAHAQHLGFDTIRERGVAAAAALPEAVVYAGFSMGAMPAQQLAQTRRGAKGALLFHSCIPTEEFGAGWPAGVPVQIHGMDADPIFMDEGDVDAARSLIASTKEAELFLYPGEQHLFADSSLASYDEGAAELLLQRTLDFLDSV